MSDFLKEVIESNLEKTWTIDTIIVRKLKNYLFKPYITGFIEV